MNWIQNQMNWIPSTDHIILTQNSHLKCQCIQNKRNECIYDLWFCMLVLIMLLFFIIVEHGVPNTKML